MLESNSRNPDIILRNRAALRSQSRLKFSIVTRTLNVTTQDDIVDRELVDPRQVLCGST